MSTSYVLAVFAVVIVLIPIMIADLIHMATGSNALGVMAAE